MLLTPIFKTQSKAEVAGWRLIALTVLMLGLLLPLSSQPRAEDERAGFFSYVPSLPKLSLPDFDITPFWTDDFKKGKKAYKNGNYERAQKYFRRASDDGNVLADWYLGYMNQYGLGMQKNDISAFSYFSRVADTYDPDDNDQTKLRVSVDAQVRLADYYRSGIPDGGIAPDYKIAASRYLTIATTYGHPGAYYGLGMMNLDGQGVTRNSKQGLKWMAAAARKRYPPAEAFLGDAYWTGRLVPKNQTRGLMWYILATQTEQKDTYPQIFSRYDELKSAASEDQKLEAEARAKVWNSQYPVDDSLVSN